jgi:hypothetical protein
MSTAHKLKNDKKVTSRSSGVNDGPVDAFRANCFAAALLTVWNQCAAEYTQLTTQRVQIVDAAAADNKTRAQGTTVRTFVAKSVFEVKLVTALSAFRSSTDGLGACQTGRSGLQTCQTLI